MAEVRVADVVGPSGETTRRGYAVLLREVGGDRVLPIWVGEFEATAIALHLAGAELPRPLTYVFAANPLAAGGARMREVAILWLVDSTFYAEAVVDGPAGSVSVDARPSDAINLALVANAPIRVAADILAANALTDEEARAGSFDGGADAIASAATARWAR